jgi:hypothetical protein
MLIVEEITYVHDSQIAKIVLSESVEFSAGTQLSDFHWIVSCSLPCDEKCPDQIPSQHQQPHMRPFLQ